MLYFKRILCVTLVLCALFVLLTGCTQENKSDVSNTNTSQNQEASYGQTHDVQSQAASNEQTQDVQSKLSASSAGNVSTQSDAPTAENGDYAKYVREWNSKGDIESESTCYLVIYSIKDGSAEFGYSSASPRGAHIASVGLYDQPKLTGRVSGNVITAEFEDSFGNYGTITLTLSQDCIVSQVEIKGHNEEYGEPLWRILGTTLY